MNLGPETEYVEYKESTADLDAGCASVAAMLNKHGRGEVFFGVRDNGDVKGQDVGRQTLRKIAQRIEQRVEPRVVPTVEPLVAEDGRTYIRVAFEGADAPYSCTGRYRVRVGDEDKSMTAAQVEETFRRRANRHEPWDGRLSPKTIADVDEATVRAYVERGVACGRIPFSYSGAEDALGRLGLLRDGRLTNAATLCFCPSDEVRLKMGMFASSDRTEILDVNQVSGTLFELADRAEYYVLNNIRRRAVIDGGIRREEVPEIPRAAIREALVNALCHRDWEDDSCVQVDIFWNAVAVFSPGRFPEGHDPDGYLEGIDTRSASRNKALAQVLFRSKEIESYGTGLRRIKGLCDAAGIGVSVRQESFGVYVRFDRPDPYLGSEPPAAASSRQQPPAAASNESWAALPERDRAVCEYLLANGTSGAAAISEALGIPRRTVGDVLARLSKGGFVVPVGENRSRKYRLSQ